MGLLTCDEVAAHKSHGELFWELVLAIPDRVTLTVKVFPKVRDGDRKGVLVGVLSLKFIHDKCAGRKKKNGVRCD